MIYAMEIGDAPETPARSKTQTKMRKRESAELDFLTLDLPPASSDDRRWWLDNGMTSPNLESVPRKHRRVWLL